MQFSFEICCRWQQVTVWAHVRLRTRFRPVSPTSLCAIASGETNCRNGTKKTLLCLSSSFSLCHEVLPTTSSSPHLIFFSTLLCLLSSFSSLHPLLPSSHLSEHSPPISALASLVSSCPPHITLPLSSVVCHLPSFLRVLPTVVCSSPVSLSSSSALLFALARVTWGKAPPRGKAPPI